MPRNPYLSTHPVREAVLDLLAQETRLSPVEMTRRLELDPPASLGVVAYHVRVLAERGTIQRVAMRRSRGAVESFYALK